ncbi:hypothetical protein OCGS_1725 [Oceaniovalibus guishaninsula JLT2003]|uniref:GP-PDE domain-containing protein n=1 Tax=Oceaniovalibus guishaninsula JLT2003 TaxID=1231392 RepID=K2HMZ8_9RHOB|nr:glycerophosphodiester phosphodiesterase family protein [Oceaniovalibus guishaninsula]EKE44209.1 hypothetical protein OCGS_1725 [Oceaniovalibus guishaninsula JLT2003]
MTLPAPFLGLPLAHRGLHGAGRPENSRGAIRAAIDAGYGIEIDVQSTADGDAMVFHDATLDRLTAHRGPVRHRGRADLSRIVLRDSDETIPPLTEVLKLVAGRTPLLIEVKDQTGAMAAGDGRLEAATARALAGYAGPVAVMSFNPHSVARLAELLPHVPRGLITGSWGDTWSAPVDTRNRLRAIPDYDICGASFISHEADDLARPRVAELKARGAAILCWTIRSPEAERAARRIADNITFEGYAAPLPA